MTGTASTTVQAEGDSRSSTDSLLRGYTGEDVGVGARFTATERPDWADPTRTLWPSSAAASSSFGGGWSESALVGAPSVFPRLGDIRGAWAPATRDSRVEWIEVGFPSPAPAAQRIRVFETNVPGSTFAVTVLRGSGAARSEELVWQRRASAIGTGGARILEIELQRAEPIERVRVYLSNDVGTGWSEIDTVGLVTAEPVPAHLQQRPAPRRAMPRGCLIAVGVAVVSAAVWLAMRGSEPSGTPTPPPATDVVQGSTMTAWTVSSAGMDQAGVVWASQVRAFSSEYGSSRYGANRALGRPDVYPTHGDHADAWASSSRDRGLEHLDLAFERPVRASAIVIVETMLPGAVARIEDISAGRPPALLWRGVTQPSDEARVLSLELPTPREVSAVRVVLDTARVAGWNEIDAVGLVPAR